METKFNNLHWKKIIIKSAKTISKIYSMKSNKNLRKILIEKLFKENGS